MNQPVKQLEVVAYGVRNLTDARYFSAMGVQWMGFPLGGQHGIPVEQVAAIIDWVEGPQYFVEVSRAQHMDIPDIRQMLKVDAIMTEGLHQPDVIQHLKTKTSDLASVPEQGPSEQILLIDFLGESDAQKRLLEDPVACGYLGQICGQRTIWIAARWQLRTFPEFIETVSPAAIVIPAGDEEVVGLKAYDEIDQIFEILG